ncbi:MAG: O-antigen ligase family protein, partial [Anaerolineales bacterium]|nr:O-antigen ligase family protein [Anaerolineales bacterium]
MAVLFALTPLRWGILILATGLAVAAALFKPLIALMLALVFGPARALLATMWPDMPLYPGQVLFVLFALSWLLRGLFRRSLRLHMPAFAVPALLYVGVGSLSLWGAADPLSGLAELVKWLQMLAVALLVSDCCRRRHLVWVLISALASGVLQAMIGLWEFGLRGSGPDTFELAPGLYRAYGTFEQPNPFGGFMGLVWPLAVGLFFGILSVSRRDGAKASRTVLGLLSIAAAVLALGGLVVSYSRGAWLGALAAALVMVVFWPHRRRWGITMAVVGLLALFILAPLNSLPLDIADRFASVTEFARVQDVRGVSIDRADFSIIERIAHWQAAIRMAAAHPWLGVG